MTTLLPKTRQPRQRHKINALTVTLERTGLGSTWFLRATAFGCEAHTVDTGTPHRSAALEFARAYIRDYTRQRPSLI